MPDDQQPTVDDMTHRQDSVPPLPLDPPDQIEMTAEPERFVDDGIVLMMQKVGVDRGSKVIFDVSSALTRRGENDKAVMILTKGWEATKVLAGERDPLTIACMANLSATLANGGEFERAERLGSEALDMRRSTLGDTHPDTLLCSYNLAAIYQNTEIGRAHV